MEENLWKARKWSSVSKLNKKGNAERPIYCRKRKFLLPYCPERLADPQIIRERLISAVEQNGIRSKEAWKLACRFGGLSYNYWIVTAALRILVAIESAVHNCGTLINLSVINTEEEEDQQECEQVEGSEKRKSGSHNVFYQKISDFFKKAKKKGETKLSPKRAISLSFFFSFCLLPSSSSSSPPLCIRFVRRKFALFFFPQ